MFSAFMAEKLVYCWPWLLQASVWSDCFSEDSRVGPSRQWSCTDVQHKLLGLLLMPTKRANIIYYYQGLMLLVFTNNVHQTFTPKAASAKYMNTKMPQMTLLQKSWCPIYVWDLVNKYIMSALFVATYTKDENRWSVSHPTTMTEVPQFNAAKTEATTNKGKCIEVLFL